MPTIEMVAWMMKVEDMDAKKYYILGRIIGMKDTLAVTPVNGHGETFCFCKNHHRAYKIGGACIDCQTQVVEVANEASVTSCDTP